MRSILSIGVAVSSIFVVVFFWNLILNINKPLGYKDDIYLEYFIQKNNLTKIVDLKFDKIYDTQMFYPSKNTLAFGGSLLTQSLIGLPVFIVSRDVVISSHFIILFAFFSAFLTMFFLAWNFTKSATGSILAGLIYTYNPFVFSHFQQFELITLQWLPLIFLFTAKFIEKQKWQYPIIVSLLIVAQIGSSFYYTFFLALILPVYILLLKLIKKVPVKNLIKLSLLLAIVVVGVFSYLYLQPFISVRETFNIERSLDANISYSAQITDFLFTSESNKLYGWMVNDPLWRSIRDSYTAVHYTEHSLFFGLTVNALLFSTLALLVAKKIKGDDKKITLIFLILLGTAFIFAFGPYVEILGRLIPLPYLIFYKFVPFVDTLRAPSRFMAIVFLALSIIIAFGWKVLITKFKKIALVILVITIILISLEYQSNIPNFYEVPPNINNFYLFLNSRKDIKVILELPITNSLTFQNYSRGALDDTIYLLYALKHDKFMINGYHGFIPEETNALRNRLSINFPTLNKLKDLKKLGVDAIIVHSDEYIDKQIAKEVVNKLQSLGAKEFYSDDPIYAFLVN